MHTQNAYLPAPIGDRKGIPVGISAGITGLQVLDN